MNRKAARFVSRLTHDTLALVLAGGRGSRLGVLTDWRTKPAVPFAGKFRIIDFTLSNCVNSGLTNVMVLTQYAPMSLNDHIGAGRPWDLDRNSGGIRIFQPFLSRGRPRERNGWKIRMPPELRSRSHGRPAPM